MKTIQTKPDCTLGFVKVDLTWHDFRTEYDGKYLSLLGRDSNDYPQFKFDPNEPDTFDETVLIGVLIEQRDLGYCPVIGKLSEITEDQAKEFFDGVVPTIWKQTGLGKLGTVAESVGIEEKDFDKYLVIKL